MNVNFMLFVKQLWCVFDEFHLVTRIVIFRYFTDEFPNTKLAITGFHGPLKYCEQVHNKPR